MTIAAGFVTRDGILLCSDSQHTAWEKTYKAKLFSRPFGFGRVSFAFAGLSDHACSIIEDCWEELGTLPSAVKIPLLRGTLRAVIKRGIAECPQQIPQSDLPQFLIGITTPSEAHLFLARDSAMPRVKKFEFLGSGAYIAEHVMKSLSPINIDGMSFEEAALVGLSVLAAAKRNDAYCGGGSQFLAASCGAGLVLGPSSVDLSDPHLNRYEFLIRNLFMSVGERHGDDAEFRNSLNYFCEEITRLRNEMRAPGSWIGAILDSLSQVSKQLA